MEIVLEVWGDFACFARPESKVERLTYPVSTPSAARGILSSIYSKPKEFYWQVNRIEVLNPIRYISFKRNEVKSRMGKALEPLFTGKEYAAFFRQHVALARAVGHAADIRAGNLFFLSRHDAKEFSIFCQQNICVDILFDKASGQDQIVLKGIVVQLFQHTASPFNTSGLS